MIKLIKFEFARAFKNIYFLIAILAGCAITVFDFFDKTYPLLWLNGMPKDPYPPLSLYTEYIGLGATSLGKTLIFLLAPLLCSLPHADSLAGDLGDGYAKNILTKSGRKKWLAAKYLSVLASGMAVFVIPFVVNLLVTSIFVPTVSPALWAEHFAAARSANPNAGLFISHPMIYIIIYLALGGVIIGLFCEVALVVSLLAQSRFTALLSPFILYMFSYVVCNLSGDFRFDTYHLINPAQVTPTSPIMPILLPLGLFFATFLPLMIFGGRRDVL